MSNPETEQNRWFAEEIHPHDPSLKGYLRGSFPAVRDIDDIVQESYLRVWKARSVQPIEFARAFLFRVARNVALDFLRHRQASPIDSVGNLERLPVIDEGRPDIAKDVERREKIRLLAEAIADLPPRCREIFILHKIKAVSRKEIAWRLGLSEKTIETQSARAMRRCATHLKRRGVSGYYQDDAK